MLCSVVVGFGLFTWLLLSCAVCVQMRENDIIFEERLHFCRYQWRSQEFATGVRKFSGIASGVPEGGGVQAAPGDTCQGRQTGEIVYKIHVKIQIFQKIQRAIRTKHCSQRVPIVGTVGYNVGSY